MTSKNYHTEFYTQHVASELRHDLKSANFLYRFRKMNVAVPALGEWCDVFKENRRESHTIVAGSVTDNSLLIAKNRRKNTGTGAYQPMMLTKWQRPSARYNDHKNHLGASSIDGGND